MYYRVEAGVFGGIRARPRPAPAPTAPVAPALAYSSAPAPASSPTTLAVQPAVGSVAAGLPGSMVISPGAVGGYGGDYGGSARFGGATLVRTEDMVVGGGSGVANGAVANGNVVRDSGGVGGAFGNGAHVGSPGE